MAKRKGKTRDLVAHNTEGGDEGADPIAREAWENWRASRMHLRDWRKEATDNYNFLAGRQWDEEDIASLQEQQRAPITFNRIHTIVNAISGHEINGRQELTFKPRQAGSGPDAQQAAAEAQVDTAAVKFFRQECDAEDEESEQFRDMIATGIGWSERRVDYDDEPQGSLRIERVDPLEMVYDPAARRPNLTDRRWDIRGKWWDKSLAKEKWPKHNFDMPVPTAYDEADLDAQPPIDRLAASFYKDTGVGEQAQLKRDKVFILEYTRFEHEKFYTMVNPTTGQTEDVESAIHAKLQSRLEERGMPRAKSVERYRKRYKRAFIHARDTIEDSDAPCPEGFHYQPMTAYRDRNKNVWFGPVSLMKDPQRWANKWLTQDLHWLNTNVKTGVWYEEGAFERPGQAEKAVAKPGFFQKIEAGYFDKVKKETPSPMPPDVFNKTEFAISSIRDVVGANIELMGQTQNEQPGVVENARKQSALTVLAPLFSAMRQYRKISGRIELYIIRKYLADQWVEITGQSDAQFVQIAERDQTPSYRVVVDQSPTSPNQKEAVFGVLSAIMPALLKAGVPIPPSIVDYVPGLPVQFAQEWKQMMVQKMNAPPAPDPKTQLAQAKLAQEAKESDRQDQIDQSQQALDRMEMQLKMLMQERAERMDREKLAFQREKMASDERRDLAKMGHATVIAHQERMHDAAEAQRDRQHEHVQGALDRQHTSQESAQDREHASAEGAEERKIKAKAAAKPKPKAK